MEVDWSSRINQLRSFETTLRNDGSWGWVVEGNDVKWRLPQTPSCGVASAEPIVKAQPELWVMAV